MHRFPLNLHLGLISSLNAKISVKDNKFERQIEITATADSITFDKLDDLLAAFLDLEELSGHGGTDSNWQAWLASEIWEGMTDANTEVKNDDDDLIG